MEYFNDAVVAMLKSQGVQLSDIQKQAYLDVCTRANQHFTQYKTKKNPLDARPYSVWHAPKSDDNPALNHWLILSGNKSWKSKDVRLVVTKLFINLETGERKFVKIRRPGTKYAAMHIVHSLAESNNNQIMGVKTDHYTRYTLTHGTKAYLFQPYRGQQNLLDLLNDPASDPSLLMNVLIKSGDLLQKMHNRGYLHADFKPQNVVFSRSLGKLALIDLEFMMPESVGECGKKEMFGTADYCHEDWIEEGCSRMDLRLPVKYSRSNDVYAFLVTASLFLEVVLERETDPQMKDKFFEMKMKIERWQNLPFVRMPELGRVLNCLQGLPETNEQTLKQSRRPKV